MTRVRIIDVESSGLDPEVDHVVEIAAWDLEPETGLIAFVGGKLVRPPVPIPPVASAVHDITDEDVARAGRWAEVYPEFIDDEVDAYCAHNAKFEKGWLGNLVAKPFICTLKCAYRIWPDAPSHSNAALRYWLKPEGLDRGLATPAHRAKPDAYVTAHLLNLMFRRPKVDLKGLIAYSSRPALLPKVRFGKHSGKLWKDVEKDYLEWMVKQPNMDEDAIYTAKHYLKD